MGNDDGDAMLRAAKRGYRSAEAEGNREEEARWANVIGDLFKRRGEYVEALRWLRIDYDLSSKHLPEKQLLPTCQSIGEIHFRLNHHKEALFYQKKHLELAKESDDIVEQQRACTQLGRTYHEIFLNSEDDHHAIRNAKKYFKLAMKFARKLRENPSGCKSSRFFKEFIDAHNNIGMLELDLDNLDEAEEILLKGLEICDEEEVHEHDAGRSRLHNNLGSVYLNLRKWSKAREHIEKDILICKGIGHREGESKGFINLGELHYRLQKYDEATKCYQKALEIAKSMEDEDALVGQITENLKITEEAKQVLEDLKKEEQKYRKLTRITCNARGTSQEREYLLEQIASLDCLIDKSRTIFHWKRHQEYAKMKKRVANELCDKEKLSDSYLVVGESYQKLRNFNKARKWYMKSWSTYKSLGNLEGQALAKINIGEVLDSSGDWAGALAAFEEGYRLAAEGKLHLALSSALENMHYSHMIRFDNIEEARKLQLEIQNLKQLIRDENEIKNMENEKCSESETEWCELSDGASSEFSALSKGKVDAGIAEDPHYAESLDIGLPIASLIKVKKRKPDSKFSDKSRGSSCSKEVLPKLNKSFCGENASRKRVRVVISDDEDGDPDDQITKKKTFHRSFTDAAATSNGGGDIQSGSRNSSVNLAQNDVQSGSLIDMENANAPKSTASDSKTEWQETSESLHFGQSANLNAVNVESDFDCNVIIRVGNHSINVDVRSCLEGDKVNCELLKVEVACLYYMQLSKDKQSKGLLPIFQNLKYLGRQLGSFEPLEEFRDTYSRNCIEVIIGAWVLKRVMKLYVECCENNSEEPNLNLLKKLYSLEVSEDEIIISNCGLQDISISPLIDALHEHKAIASLDISHNFLGNETMERLQKVFTLSSQTYGSLSLDFHCNRFGPISLFQICECPAILARLEVLNLSGNRLTDACCSYLSAILSSCKALYSLSIEQCSITSRTIQRIADVLDDNHVLSQLRIGGNKPISSSSLISLVTKLAKLKGFSDLSLMGIKLNKNMIGSVCELVRNANLSSLILGSTSVGSAGVDSITEALSAASQELVKLDISSCGIVAKDFAKLCANSTFIGGLYELNLEGNTFGSEVCHTLESILSSQCPLKILILNNCQLGQTAIVRLIQALEGNVSLEELYVADNANVVKEATQQHEHPLQDITESSNQTKAYEPTSNMEVADSEDELTKDEVTGVGINRSCFSAGQQNPKPLATCPAVQELSVAISSAKMLSLLDLSHNGFSPEDIELLYASWSCRTRVSSCKHLAGGIVHFSLEGKRCCGIRACCKKDGMV